MRGSATKQMHMRTLPGRTIPIALAVESCHACQEVLPILKKKKKHMRLSMLYSTISSNVQLTSLFSQGKLADARQLFDAMPHRTVVSWNAGISGYSKLGLSEEAVVLATDMHRSGTKLNEASFTAILTACSRSNSLDLGRQIHCLILKSGSENFELVGCALLNLYTSSLDIYSASHLFELLHRRNPLLWSVMLVGYVRCNLMDDAHQLFEKMPSRDAVSWTALISGYSKSSDGLMKAFKLFVQMRREGTVLPNEFTYDTVLRACFHLDSLNYGRMIHSCLVRCGLELDRSICGALIELYCSWDAIEDAKRIFEDVDSPSVSTSNSMISSLVSINMVRDAEMVFRNMIERDSVSYNMMLKGYALDGRISDSVALFKEMPCRNIVSVNTMITVYHRHGDVAKAIELFEDVRRENNTVTWNSMISGFIQNEQPAEALKLYVVMCKSAIECSRSTFSALFRACASLGTLKQGKMLHAHLCKTPFDSNTYVGTSLVDMYAKCGSIPDGKAAFSNILSPNVAAWTALINGLAQHGYGHEALIEFGLMLKNHIEPNSATFVPLLLACARAGLRDKGMSFFNCMKGNYGLIPTVEHYTCLIYVLGRSGRLKEAKKLVDEMPIEADSVVWGALLDSCWHFMDLETGAEVCEKILSLNAGHISPYVIMSNIYAKLGRWEEVVKVRRSLRDLNVRKEPGCSWIEVKETVHVFTVEDRNHPKKDQIYVALEDLIANFCSCSESSDLDWAYNSYQVP